MNPFSSCARTNVSKLLPFCHHYQRIQNRRIVNFAKTLPQYLNAKNFVIAYIALFVSYQVSKNRELIKGSATNTNTNDASLMTYLPRMQIISDNHCYSPVHLSSIFTLIYPKILTTFRENSEINIPSKYSSLLMTENDTENGLISVPMMKNDLESLIAGENGIDIHQKVWIDEQNMNWNEKHTHCKLMKKSMLHQFHLEYEHLTWNEINSEKISAKIEHWLNKFYTNSLFSIETEANSAQTESENIEIKSKGTLEFKAIHSVCNCPLKHGLEEYITSQDHFVCNECKSSLPTDTIIHGCRICNYDICNECMILISDQTAMEKKENIDGLRMAVANTLTLDTKLKSDFMEIDCSEVPFSEFAFEKTVLCSKSKKEESNESVYSNGYLKSVLQQPYKYMQYKNHEVIILPFENDCNLHLILSLPMIDEKSIEKILKLQLKENEKTFNKTDDELNKKELRNRELLLNRLKSCYFCNPIHPNRIQNIFHKLSSDSNSETEMKDDAKQCSFECLEVYFPIVDKYVSNTLIDHHLSAIGLNHVILPLYYGDICLQRIDLQSHFTLNANKTQFELLSVAYFDEGSRVWAAMRWKYMLRDFKMRRKSTWKWTDFRIKWKKEKVDDLNESESEFMNENDKKQILVFDHPFDYYLYDSYNKIVFVAGTIVE